MALSDSDDMTDDPTRDDLAGEPAPAVAPFTVLVDSREMRPYRFERITAYDPAQRRHLPVRVPTVTLPLQTSDYTIAGHEARIAVERKCLSDLFHCCGIDRDRFQRELARMAEIPSAHLLIESSFEAMFHCPPPNSRMKPAAVAGSLFAWQQRFGVAVWFADTRRSGEWMCFHILRRFHEDLQKLQRGELLGNEPWADAERQHRQRIREHSRRCQRLRVAESLAGAANAIAVGD